MDRSDMFEYADVAVPVAVRATFSYAVPVSIRTRLKIGARVLAPFGRKVVTGIVVGGSQLRPQGDFRIRQLRELLDDSPVVPAHLVDVALWVARHYFTYPGEVLKILFPAGSQASGIQNVRLSPRTIQLLAGGFRPTGLRSAEDKIIDALSGNGSMTLKELQAQCGLRDIYPSVDKLSAAGWVVIDFEQSRPRVGAREQAGIRALEASEEILANLPPAQRRIYESMEPAGLPLPLQEILRLARSSASSARSLQSKGLAVLAPMQINRMPIDLSENPACKVVTLTGAQQQAFDTLSGMLRQKSVSRCLLHGVTGSGKTEVYLRLIAEVIRGGGTALFLVPEIGLTPLLSRIALSHFPDQVALLHSGMSPGERYDQWNRIRTGRSPVVVGTRSAVFAPLDNLRLVIIDEEQDSSYKQDEPPCYHAREVAWQRLRGSSGLLLLGSATPSVETYYAATVTREIHLMMLPERIEARPMPQVTVVDMCLEFQRRGRKTVVSEPLLHELRQRIERREQSIVLLNRRGYARTLLCRSCGHAYSCPDCSIAMPFHHEENLLLCHYCGRQEKVPEVCASCGGDFIYFVGVGTEQLEEMLHSLLPDARIARVDRDTMKRKGALRKVLLDFSEHKIDLLVGTQILAKGHDFPNVTLVGVVAADAGLSFPDFRSAERTFQLLTQVAGRAGRGRIPGRVIVQSFYPDHYALQFARKQDYAGFFNHEIEYRQMLGYPPYRNLVQILVTEESQMKAIQIGGKIASALKACASESRQGNRIVVLGPASAPLEKLRGKYRIQILIKAASGDPPINVLHTAFDRLAGLKVPLKGVQVDVDPLSLL